MSLSHTVKKNNSSLQVLKTYQVLLENAYTMSELVQKLNENEKEPVFNNSVISKYINTCRYCGFNIQKIQNKYHIAESPFNLNLSTEDVEIIETIQKICKQTFSKKFNKYFDSFLEKINRHSNKKILKVETQTLNIICEAFEKSIQESRKIRLFLKNKLILDCIPLGITTHNKKVYLNVKHEKKEKFISLSSISGHEELQQTFITPSYDAEEAIFKITGNLSSRYNLKENEKLISHNADFSIISNIGEEKDILLSRLLRYDSLCEVTAPLNYRETMKKIIDDTLANYGE